MTVTGFCEVAGIPRATWCRWRRASSAATGPWPTPARDAVEADAKTLAADWEGWGTASRRPSNVSASTT